MWNESLIFRTDKDESVGCADAPRLKNRKFCGGNDGETTTERPLRVGGAVIRGVRGSHSDGTICSMDSDKTKQE